MDEAVTANDDEADLRTDQGSVGGNVLLNDLVPDLVANITLDGQPDHGSVSIAADGDFVFTLDPSDVAVQGLGRRRDAGRQLHLPGDRC